MEARLATDAGFLIHWRLEFVLWKEKHLEDTQESKWIDTEVEVPSIQLTQKTNTHVTKDQCFGYQILLSMHQLGLLQQY